MKFSVKQYSEALYQTLAETKPSDADKVINNFIRILNQNGDLHYYETIIQEYENYDRDQKGIKEVEITTASTVKLNSTLVKELNDILESNIELKQKVDESLIGGVVVKIEDTLIDASIKGQLNKLKNRLTK